MCSKPRKWKFRIKHILQAMEKIRKCTDGLNYENFENDWILVDAVQMNLLVIGEAARHIPDSIIEQYPEIPWLEMRGLRNVLAHEYDRVDFDIIWRVIQEELPPLVPQLEHIFGFVKED
ncbi:DUF86 domain-containing protein [bacterium]|nr:DUF86 domain-containing protein [bacterium]